MANKPAQRLPDGSVVRPQGQASSGKVSATGRSFTPLGARSASGPAIRPAVPLHPVDKTAADKVTK